MNAIALPSGDQRGVFSVFSPAMSGCSAPPDRRRRGATQMSAFRLPADRSVVVRTNATVRPSGESCGSATRTASSRSRIVIARPDCARSASVPVPKTAATTRSRASLRKRPPQKMGELISPEGRRRTSVRTAGTGARRRAGRRSRDSSRRRARRACAVSLGIDARPVGRQVELLVARDDLIAHRRIEVHAVASTSALMAA